MSCNKETFKKAIPSYNNALKKVDSKRTWYIHIKPLPVAILIRNKKSARSYG